MPLKFVLRRDIEKVVRRHRDGERHVHEAVAATVVLHDLIPRITGNEAPHELLVRMLAIITSRGKLRSALQKWCEFTTYILWKFPAGLVLAALNDGWRLPPLHTHEAMQSAANSLKETVGSDMAAMYGSVSGRIPLSDAAILMRIRAQLNSAGLFLV